MDDPLPPKLQTLSPERISEVEDFIDFLSQRDSDRQLLQPGDRLLFCGTEKSETLLSATMNNVYTLDYLITGIDKPRGYVFQWLLSDNR